MFYFTVATIFFIGTTSGQRLPICGQNEEYQDCGTECPQTCLDIFEPRECSDVCVQGCFCKDGFVRAGENGLCVPVKSCKNVPKCAKNEIYTQCAPLCQNTCVEHDPKLCPNICVEGCVCQEGYVRSIAGGRCVPKDACNLQICKAHQVYKECGSACPGTCHQQHRVCEEKCVTGCFCQGGYVLDPDTQECVKIENCPDIAL